MDYDLFISHASEDKNDVARPLAKHLQQLGLRVWFDEFELILGDSLRRKIDHGLSRSRYGVVVLSPAFFAKEWPNKELDGLVARDDDKEKVVLPVWHNISAGDIRNLSPMLADRVAVSTSLGIMHVATAVYTAVKREPITKLGTYAQIPNAETEPLSRIRQGILISPSSRELRRSMYELESYLAQHPYSPEAKELRDQLQVALRRAELYEGMTRPSMSSPPCARSGLAPKIRLIIVALVIAIVTVYAALRFLHTI